MFGLSYDIEHAEEQEKKKPEHGECVSSVQDETSVLWKGLCLKQ